ncbi:ABC transporter ATP-binding protein [Falsirhodobacter sp. 1013]|uniref:ABC transporter ATP-binding protein n=1 Tax=Falsirhodobacter sp. 1013 TaxID=3417566 RepID=UPI003EBBE7AF
MMTTFAATAPVGEVHGARVEFHEIAKDYGTTRVLQSTTLTIERGELFAMIGPSGSGKSTLLSILAGFVLPSEGQVLLDGQGISTTPPYQRNIGMVFQSYALFPHRTVAENIAFPLIMRKLPKTVIKQEVERALVMVRLEAMANRRPSQLSGGQQQRVALARASVYKPRLLLMDEPLGALDKNLREEMQEEIKAFQRTLGVTMVYVTHDQQEAAFLADRLAVLNQGRLEQIGSPRDLYDTPTTAFVAGFLGEMTMIELAEHPRASTEGHGMAKAHNGPEIKVPLPKRRGSRHRLCIRPENIRLGQAALDCDNSFLATVEESLFTTGSFRYKLKLKGTDTGLMVRVPSHPGDCLLAKGSDVPIGWNVNQTVTLTEG